MANARKNNLVSVITPSYGRFESLVRCIESVRKSRPLPEDGIELIVVTSGYSDSQLADLRDRDCRIVSLAGAVPTSESRNRGAAVAAGTYLLFLDDDNIVASDALWLLWRSLSSWSDAAIVGPAMYYGSEPARLWCAGVTRSRFIMRTSFRQELPPTLPERLRSEDFPNCFMVRHNEFDQVSGFDAQRFPQQWEEGDIARRIARGTRHGVYLVPSARIWHYIDVPLTRRLHLRNAERAFLVARGRGMFTAVHGSRLQWAIYVLGAQWIFAAFYLAAAFSVPPTHRKGIPGSYLRGLWSGLIDGWRARAHDRSVSAGVAAVDR